MHGIDIHIYIYISYAHAKENMPIYIYLYQYMSLYKNVNKKGLKIYAPARFSDLYLDARSLWFGRGKKFSVELCQQLSQQ